MDTIAVSKFTRLLTSVLYYARRIISMATTKEMAMSEEKKVCHGGSDYDSLVLWEYSCKLLLIGIIFLAACIITPTVDIDIYTYPLMMGDRGPLVEKVQSALNDLHYYEGSIDGVFSESLRDAVIRFQYDVGITNDGVVGPVTWRELLNLDNRE